MTDARTRHGRGLAIVILLAVIFFVLLALIVVRAGKNEPKEVQVSETLTVLPARIRIRTEPNARAAVVAQAKSGDRLTLLEDRGAWVRVETGEKLSGWAERAYLERTIEQQRRLERYKAIRRLPPLKGEAGERTPLYAGPGIFYPLLGELPRSSNVVVFTRDHDFYAIDHDGSVAYASVDAIDVSSTGTRQLEVASGESAATDTTNTTDTTTMTNTTAVTETTATEPLPVPPTPAPAPSEPSGGVYAAVPPGGTQPEEVDRVIPAYPSAARRAGIGGPVVVRGIVRKDGTIDNVEIIRDLPYGLGESARRAVSRWRFRPATFAGEPIDVYYTVTVNFRLR
ncbi:MAG TPA: TonB family protein [Thermoanaerobaculia bacterium]|nr:TonB family protein [Thermoanaerobaculia bacterium]